MESFAVDADGKQVSFARRGGNVLADPDRIFGVKSHIKSKKREDNRKVRKRFYWVLDYRDDDVRIPLEHTNFKIVSGFDKPTYIDEEGKTKEYPKNGIADHYNFVTHPKMPLNVVAARRYPCLCDPCFQKSIIPWDNEKEYADQDRWETAEDCEYSCLGILRLELLEVPYLDAREWLR
jgi:hypothetical protein